MQSYLLIGTNTEKIEQHINLFIQKHGLQRINIDLTSIDSVRNLNRFTSLGRGGTAIVIKNIKKASEEALNAFLKNLEEPQTNLYYILCSNTKAGILPTILSRCQITRITGNSQLENEDVCRLFFNSDKPDKIKLLTGYTDREEVITLLNNLLIYYHQELMKSQDKLKISKDIESILKTLKFVKANGNITLQLTSMVVNLV